MAADGFHEFNLGGCSVSDFAGESETCKDSKGTCKLTVGSLINKTPKGAGCLFFGLIFLPKGTKTPFITDTFQETGLDYWGYAKIDIPYISKFYKLNRIYESDCFTLNENEDIEEDRDFNLHRTDISLPPGEYDMYAVLYEEIENGKKLRVAWCNVGSHITQDEHLQEIESENGKIAKVGDATQFGSPAFIIEKNGIKANGKQQIDVILDRKFSLEGKNAPAELWMRLYLTDVETGSKYKSNATKHFTVGADGVFAPYIDTNEKLNIPFKFDNNIPEGVYDITIELYELKAVDGKGSKVGEVTITYFSKENYGHDIVVFNGEEINNEFKGLRKIGNNGKKSEISIQNASYIWKGDKATVKIGKLLNKGSEPTGSLRITLDFILPNNNVVVHGGQFYKRHMEGGYSYSKIEQTIDFSVPAEYNDDTSLRIAVYELNGNKKWDILDKVKFKSINKSINEKKEQEKWEAEQAVLAKKREKEDAVLEEKRKKERVFYNICDRTKVEYLPFILMFSVPFWFNMFKHDVLLGPSVFLLIIGIECIVKKDPVIFRFLPCEIGIIVDVLFVHVLSVFICDTKGTRLSCLLLNGIVIACMSAISILLHFLLKISKIGIILTILTVILTYVICISAFVIPIIGFFRGC